MPVQLSAAESALLVTLVSDVRMMLPVGSTSISELSATDARTLKRLVKKGLIDMESEKRYRVNQAGLDRAKQIY